MMPGLLHVLVGAATCASGSVHGGRAGGARAPRALVRLSTPATSAGGARLLWADKLSRANDGKVFQFDQISLQLLAGQRLGLVGPNGCGKSTLLKTLAQVETADQGAVERSRGARILYVEQEPPLRGTTIREAVYTGIEADSSSQADCALRAAYAYHMASLAADTQPAAFEAAAAAATAADCWDDDARARAICDVLGLSDILDKDVASCSGGERKRAGLAAALARQPDALLLDEPTNHLDGRAVQWLAELLTTPASNLEMPAVLCVSHDRAFLEQVCADGLLELDRAQLHLYDWKGDYLNYLQLKDERLGAERGVAERARTVLRKEREWMARQPQARQAKSLSRQQRYFKLEDAAAAGGPAAGAQLAGLAGMKRLGGKVLEFTDVTLAPDLADEAARAAAIVVRGFTHTFTPRSRWGVVGPNGAGKTTLLRAIAGQLAPLSGSRVVGETVRFGYYDQRGLEGVAERAAAEAAGGADGGGGGSAVDPMSLRVLEFVARCVDDARRSPDGGAADGAADGASVIEAGAAAAGEGGSADAVARRLLNLLAFPQDKWGAYVGRLSGGERRRLQLLAVLARSPNLLILDEPTNDLDLPTIAALEQFLNDEFSGVLICVSHDRAFVDRACTDGVLAFLGDGRVVPMEGGYGEYLETLKAADGAARAKAEAERRAKAEAASGAGGAVKRAVATSKTALKLSFKEAKEYETIEDDVNALRKELATAEAAVAAACREGKDHVLVAELSAVVDGLAARADAKEERWLELMERVEEVALANAA
jgi:ATP-binding cassette subfamily F protein uup